MKFSLYIIEKCRIFLTRPPRFDILSRYINNKKLKILDVGCGNHSPILTKMYFP